MLNPYFMLAMCVGFIGVFVTIVLDAGKNDPNQKVKHIAKLSRRYDFYFDNPFTRKKFRKISEQLSSLQLYSIVEIRVRTVQTFERVMLMIIVIFVVGVFTIQDVVSIAMLCLFLVIMYDVLVSKKIDDSQKDMTIALSHALASLRDNYTKYREIPESVRRCEKAPILENTFDTIYRILTDEEGEDILNAFYLTQPFPRIKTLASVCYQIDKYGDESDNGTGVSSFKQALMMIKDEVDLDVRELTRKKILFGRLEFLPVVPILAVGIIQKFFMGIIPGTSLLYKGIYGYLIRILLVATSTYGYYYITNATRNNYTRTNDRLEVVDSLLNMNWFRSIVKAIEPKKFKDIVKWTERLKGCLSNKDIHYIYASKLLISTAVLIFSIFASIALVVGSRNFIYKNIQPLSFTSATHYTVSQEQQLRAYDAHCLAQPVCPNDDEIKQQIEMIILRAGESDLQDQADRIHDKYDAYHKLYYHWWFVLIVIALATASWFIPEFLLTQRKKIVLMDAEEDVLQMQTLISILMSTSLDTQEVLYWLAKNSNIHKEHLNFAYVEYSMDAEKAINRLKRNSVIPEFHQMCDKLLLTCFNISLKEAFSDLVPERAHLIKVREMVQDNALQTKRQKASPRSQLPLYVAVFGLVVAPMLILGITQYQSVMDGMTF